MKTVYSLWLQGYESAPDQVKICLDRWERLNPTYDFKLLEADEVEALISPFSLEIDGITKQSLSDIVRLALLKKTGGIWADATVFPTKPLSTWFEETVGDSDFFSYRREDQRSYPKDRPISAWFMYAKEQSIILEKLWKETVRYWSVKHYPIDGIEVEVYQKDPIGFMRLLHDTPNAPYPYHWLQHIFAYLIKTDPVFGKVWKSCPNRSISIPHQIQYWVKEELLNKHPVSILTEEKIENIIKNSEMQKLNWRMNFPIDIMEKYSIKL